MIVRSDITVVGGGLAGVCAAIAAARLGARVALVNNRPVLGGNSSSEVRVWVCGATSHGAQKYARETGIMGELFLENQFRNPEGSPVLWDHVVLDAVRAEPGIRLFLNTDVHDVEASGPDDARIVHAVSGWQQGSERRLAFTSPLFVDATGDGLVGALAGARHRQGREARSEFGEAWAPEIADSDMLGSTMLFYTKDAGRPVRFVPPDIAKDIASTSILRHRRISAADNGCDYWWIEWGGELDAVADNEAIRDELWGVIFGIWDHIKNSGRFDADTLTLEWVGSVPGKREYRRFVGDHTLVQQEIMAQERFDDRVAFGGWSIDLHPPGGMYAEAEGSKHLFTSGVYHVPWRSLYSANVGNLLVAGRDISASHVAFGTTRVMATCAATGEAAGTGAALAVARGLSPRELGRDHLPLLHRTLLRQDAPVLGVEWDDPDDLALTARVTASSTLRDLSTPLAEGAPEAPVRLDGVDLGIHLPADPAIDVVEVLVDADAPTTLEIELWSTDRGENHIPVRRIGVRTVPVPDGRGWVRAEFGHRPSAPEDVVVVLHRNPLVSVVTQPVPAPYGVLALLSRTPGHVDADNARHPQTNAWSAIELRRSRVVSRVGPPTDAFRAANVAGGHPRPFGGPNLWSSERLEPGRPESVELAWDAPQTLSRIDLLFNDDVDEDIVNLHHHETPFPVIPHLVERYDLDALVAGEWTPLARVEGSRRRLRRHVLDNPLTASALRLVVHTTHGFPWATVHGIRVH